MNLKKSLEPNNPLVFSSTSLLQVALAATWPCRIPPPKAQAQALTTRAQRPHPPRAMAAMPLHVSPQAHVQASDCATLLPRNWRQHGFQLWKWKHPRPHCRAEAHRRAIIHLGRAGEASIVALSGYGEQARPN